MPKLEPKIVQKELDSGRLRPVYWLYGTERMKSRELLRRIRKVALGQDAAGTGGGRMGFSAAAFGEEILDGSEVSPSDVVDSAQSLALGGGVRFIVVRDAHSIKDQDRLAPLLEAGSHPAEPADLPYVVVFLSKDLDGRKKFSKLLTEKAAVVPCEEVPEEEREAWIQYLAKRRGLELSPAILSQLRGLDPWTLDIIDLELEKYSIAHEEDILLGSLGSGQGTEAFLEAFFGREKARALGILDSFVESPDQTLPLLGLLAWNTRFLCLVIRDNEKRTRFAKLSPYLSERFTRWSKRWSLEDALELQEALAILDFETKQTARSAVGLWGTLVQQFGR